MFSFVTLDVLKIQDLLITSYVQRKVDKNLKNKRFIIDITCHFLFSPLVLSADV